MSTFRQNVLLTFQNRTGFEKGYIFLIRIVLSTRIERKTNCSDAE